MSGDATILEGPVTPAPLFAYRAIRSIFFASPDSSPEHHDKENIIPAYASSPTKSNVILPNSPQATPSQKRKKELGAEGGAILSPTKGILRTPGLATPRARYLRDLNVKFKSVSPESRRPGASRQKESPLKTKAQDAPLQAVRPSKSTNELVPASQLPVPQAHISQAQSAKVSAVAETCPLAPATLEAYIAQTEKEMKRLIRYGKKMREYALRKDAENQELKIMIEELRKENKGLTSGRVNDMDAENDKALFALGKQKGDQARDGTMATSKAISPASRNKDKGYVRDEVNRVDTTVRPLSLTDSKPTPQPRQNSSVRLNPERSTTLREEQQAPQVSSAQLVPQTLSNPPESEAARKPPLNPPETIPASNNGTLRLPPDRAAAARERLRKRAEARKAYGGTETEVEARETEVMQVPVEEPSDLWANL